ncbi:MAG: metal-dependent transcriptional regulator [Desulfobacteraceae bacterium]|nr:metal-dependent transcriptional regulator [Desulfobacteraceae bacterium]
MTETHDEILEAMWACAENNTFAIEDIKKRCAVEFSETDLETLVQQGLIKRDLDQLILSKTGKHKAKHIMRRHRLAEVLTSSVLHLKNAQMEKVACQVEHSLEPEVEESICTLLGHPEICPDGKPIPRGRCCKKGIDKISSTVVSLIKLAPGERGKITYIKPGTHTILHQLISFGLNPGVVVTVHREKPAFCIKFENTELALDKEIAGNIFVWKIHEEA